MAFDDIFALHPTDEPTTCLEKCLLTQGDFTHRDSWSSGIIVVTKNVREIFSKTFVNIGYHFGHKNVLVDLFTVLY